MRPWLYGHLEQDDLSTIAAAIRNAEVKTSAEIVPVIVRRSALYGRTTKALAMLLIVIVLTQQLSVFDGLTTRHLALVVGLSLFALFVSWFDKTALALRMFTPDEDLEKQTQDRALLEFYQLGLAKTRGATGILIFLSLDEHAAIVLADASIKDKLPAATWDEVCNLIVDGAKNRRLAEGLTAAITRCGELAQQHFPPAAHNPNELRDRLIIKE